MRRQQDAVVAIERAVAAALGDPLPTTVYVGFSGGIDSTVLLHAAVRHCAGRTRVRAVHVDHGLHADAAAWQRHCEGVCAQLNVPLLSHAVEVQARRNVEAAARDARYAVWNALLQRGQVLLLGHQRDDQIETLLLRLILRGGGADLLAGMRPRRPLGEGELLRPLLDLPRRSVRDYAAACELRWIEDPSNLGQRFDRNFLRHEILPRLAARWPGAQGGLARAVVRLREDAEFTTQALDAVLAHCIDAPPSPSGAGLDGAALAIVRLLAQPAPGRVVRHWLAGYGLHRVSERGLEAFIAQLHAPPDRHPVFRVDRAHSIRRFRGLLHLVVDAVLQPPPPGQAWQVHEPLRLVTGSLSASRLTGPGLDGSIASLRVEYGDHARRLRPYRRTGSRSVKRLLHDARVPPWLRPAWPLLFHGEDLVAVPGVAVDASRARDRGSNWQLEWLPVGISSRHARPAPEH
jgi:tRNA(Ile)-lysidine synthase